MSAVVYLERRNGQPVGLHVLPPIYEGGEPEGATYEALSLNHPDVVAFRNPPPTIDDYRKAIETHVDAVAGERHFRSADSARSHIASTVPEWRADAEVFIAWSDQVWLYAFQELDQVQSGERQQPTIEVFIGELPVIVWPA